MGERQLPLWSGGDQMTSQWQARATVQQPTLTQIQSRDLLHIYGVNICTRETGALQVRILLPDLTDNCLNLSPHYYDKYKSHSRFLTDHPAIIIKYDKP